MKTDLTAKQLEFCKHILLGEYQTEAYTLSYDCENMSAKTVTNEASKLMKNSKVVAFIEDIYKREVLRVFSTRQKYLAKLDDIIESDITTQGEKIQAINTIAKLRHWDKKSFGDTDLTNICERIPELQNNSNLELKET